ncbi:MAG: amidohydrolase family protein [bacterium]|nr:amidohydrolase family protein [bacterium]
MMDTTIIDAHAHCGIQDQFGDESFEAYYSSIEGSSIAGVVMFPPVQEIYDRDEPDFIDNPQWQERRKKANDYVLSLAKKDFTVIPYFFIWNDFAVEQLSSLHKGIKWHRHFDEPIYHYDDPRCKKAIDEIRKRNMPIILEEELKNTVRFIHEIATGVRVIIPHLGGLNGGYRAISKNGLWELPNVYADTALASSSAIMDYVQRYGTERIMFGSDFPFGDPIDELSKIQKLDIPEETKKAILGLNLKRLLLDSNR